MIVEILNATQKKITAENGLVLTNGGEFDKYPIELIANINDDTWYEIAIENNEPNNEPTI